MIIITGANGFIGSAFVWELNEHGRDDLVLVDHVFPAERPEPLRKRKYKKFVAADSIWDYLSEISSSHSQQSLLPPDRVDWVIHMGANSSTTETNLQHLWENNTFYTQRLFEWCAAHKVPFIYASSAATYGNGELGFNDCLDSEQLIPLNGYGYSKVAFDRWAIRNQLGIQNPPHWYGLRFFNVYGPQEEHKGAQASLVGRARIQIKTARKLRLFKSYAKGIADGYQQRDFIYVKDVTRWMRELMEKKPQSGIYNVGSGRAQSWVDLGRAVFKCLNISEDIEFIDMPSNIRNAYQYFTEAELSKWLSAGMSPPKWDLDSGVRDYVLNYLETPSPLL